MKKLLYGKASAFTQDIALLIFRVIFGFTMLPDHGWLKLLHYNELRQNFFYNFLGMGSFVSATLAVFAEFFCSIFIILGLFTRLSTIPLMILLFVAASVHDWGVFYNKDERIILFFFGYFLLFLLGPGKYSFDRVLFKK